MRPLADGDKTSICLTVCALVLAAIIGGTLMGSHSGLHATKLDSHANMAVAGSDCTVIATSGCHATVTPFSSNLPTMDMVEIGDVTIAYNDPISLQMYLLVMRNALLIPTMDHNLIPPFLIWLAGLQVDETPKHQLASPTVDNHPIYDSETGMRIHLKLNKPIGPAAQKSVKGHLLYHL